MHKYIIVILLFITTNLNAGSPATQCPDGWAMVNEKQLSIATQCPANTTSAGTANSCLTDNPTSSCIMYVPVGTSWTDEFGTYEYTEPCPLS